jgi:ribosomal-protein-alanine N-acetyltransferase
MRCADWLRVWEPMRAPKSPDPALDLIAFTARCSTRDRERQLGVGYAHGIFVDQRLVGEMNLSNVRRGAMQSGDIGYWVDQEWVGQGIAPEALVGVLGLAFDQVGLRRVEISIIPRNSRSRRVVEKLGIRSEGVAHGFLEINGVREDHVRYGITLDEWTERAVALRALVGSRV